MNTTRTITIFLASSNELINDRNSFQAFTDSLDNIYENRGCRIKCLRWEDFPAYCTGERTQDAYNRIVRASDMCITMFHTQAGKYTLEEFHQAMDGYRENGNPKTYVYARVLVDGEMESEELKSFKRELNEVMGHYWCNYANDDAMRLHFVMQFERLMSDDEVLMSGRTNGLQVSDGVVRLHGREVARYENLAFASQNEEYKRLKGEIETLEKDIITLRALQNDLLQPMINEKLTQQNQAREMLQKLEESLFDTALYISKMLGSDSPISPRKRAAIEFFEMGNNKGVLETLRMEDIAADAENAAQRREKLRQMRESIEAADKKIVEEIRSLIEEYGLRAKALMQEYSNPNRFTEACQAYEAAIALAEKHLAKEEVGEQYFEYASFLDSNKQLNKAIEYNCEALKIFAELAEENPEENLSNVAGTQNNLANLYTNTNRYEDAEVLYKEALENYTKLFGQDSDAFYEKLFLVNNNLAMLYYETQRLKEAEMLYISTLSKIKPLSDRDEKYLWYVAFSQSNLANIFYDTNRFEEAKLFYIEALKIYEKLSEEAPEEYLHYASITKNNLAGLYYENGYKQESEELYLSLLVTYEQLVEKNPQAYLPGIAIIQYNMATLYYEMGQLDKSEMYFSKALEVRTQLAKEQPEAYQLEVANTQNNLANLYSDMGRYEESETLLKNALEIRQKYAEKYPDLYLPEVAMVHYNLAVMYRKAKRYEEALDATEKAWTIYDSLNSDEENKYAQDIEDTEYLISLILDELEA